MSVSRGFTSYHSDKFNLQQLLVQGVCNTNTATPLLPCESVNQSTFRSTLPHDWTLETAVWLAVRHTRPSHCPPPPSMTSSPARHLHTQGCQS
jgi:hypothetical protein